MVDRSSKFPFKYPTKGRAVRPTRKAAMQWAHSYSPVPILTNERPQASKLMSKASAHHGHQPSRSIAHNAARSMRSPCAIRISMLPWTMPPIHAPLPAQGTNLAPRRLASVSFVQAHVVRFAPNRHSPQAPTRLASSRGPDSTTADAARRSEPWRPTGGNLVRICDIRRPWT
jgi:hypothetical protein